VRRHQPRPPLVEVRPLDAERRVLAAAGYTHVLSGSPGEHLALGVAEQPREPLGVLLRVADAPGNK
jgi:hypothetical protein